MPYLPNGEEFHMGMRLIGIVSRWGVRTLQNPYRIEFDLLMPSQEERKTCARCTVYDPHDIPGSNDYVELWTNRPHVHKDRLMVMAFGKDVKILNRWISKKEFTCSRFAEKKLLELPKDQRRILLDGSWDITDQTKD